MRFLDILSFPSACWEASQLNYFSNVVLFRLSISLLISLLYLNFKLLILVLTL